MDTIIEENPWTVATLEEFLYFCCPECDERNQSRELFIEHALNHHQKAQECLIKFIVKAELNLDTKPDTEFVTEAHDNFDNQSSPFNDEVKKEEFDGKIGKFCPQEALAKYQSQ